MEHEQAFGHLMIPLIGFDQFMIPFRSQFGNKIATFWSVLSHFMLPEPATL